MESDPHLTENWIHVVAAVIERDGNLLLCRRPYSKRHGGLWEFPGGKLDVGESHHQAAIRELKEELGVTVSNYEGVIFSVRDPNSVFVIDFVRVSIHGDPVAVEHEEIRWVARDNLLDLNLAPSDRTFARHLVEQTI